MCPVDTAGLPKRDKLPVPSIAHSIFPCDQCGRECWIGPAQLKVRLLNGSGALCYWCVFASDAFRGDQVHIVGLDPDADERPRRR